MAIILPDLYPGRANPVSVDYPQGSFKDRSAPGAMDGTPLKADWANDKEGFFQSLLKDAGITPSGVVDTAESSQYFEALKYVMQKQDSGRVVFSNPGVYTWVVPDVLKNGYKKATVKGVGGGGGAVRRSSSGNATGGAGGGYFEISISLEGVDSVPITIGAAGTVGAVNADGSAGGTTSFGTYASASGGSGGVTSVNFPQGGIAVSSIVGAILVNGQAGGLTVMSNTSGASYAGAGGSSLLGLGGQASISGVSATGFGAGGGASFMSSAVNSTGGVVIIEW